MNVKQLNKRIANVREDLAKLERLSKLSEEDLKGMGLRVTPLSIAAQMVEQKKYLDHVANTHFNNVGSPVRCALPLKRQRELGMLPYVEPASSLSNNHR